MTTHADLDAEMDRLIARDEPMKKLPTAEEKRHWERVAAMGCLVCGYEAEIHHVTGQADRIGRLPRRHDRVVPLCPFHHRITAPGGHKESVEALSHRGFFRKFWIDLHRVAELLWEERETA